MKLIIAIANYVSLFRFASGATTSVTPVQKVIQLLQGMLEKGKKLKKEEQVSFAEYNQWCKDTLKEKQRAMEGAQQQVGMLEADIQKYEADAQLLVEEIAKIDEDVSVWSGDIKAATKVRGFEKEDYTAAHKDYTESIEALGMAINVLKKQAYDRKQAATALAQLKSSTLIPQDYKRVIDAFLAHDPEASEAVFQSESMLQVSAPEANAYEFQSQGVIDMLEKLKDKFVDEQRSLEKEEIASKHAYETLMEDLKSSVSAADAMRGEKTTAKAKQLQGAADAKADLEDTTATRTDDSKYVKDITSTCEQEASDYSERQKLRADEIVALEKAIGILSSGSVSGAAEEHLPALLQATHSVSFAQLRTSTLNPSQIRVAEYLKSQASLINSRVLSALAVRVEEDPFKKVKKMIQDLISNLVEEAGEEGDHKEWCDTEISTNDQTRKEKTEAVEIAHAEIDELTASIAKLAASITELSGAVADLDSAVADYTKSRQLEKEKNAATIKDAQDAQTAVAQAVAVLKEFYAKDSALVQQPEDAGYQGMQAESGGVIGMLEVIQSDFARLEAETIATENQSQKEYERFMTDSKVDKVQKNSDIEHKTEKKQDETQVLLEKKKDLLSTQQELDSALAYYDKLKTSCLDTGESYEERVARRKEELASLQEALRILNGGDPDDIVLLTKDSRSLK